MIGGNTELILQIDRGAATNSIGEAISNLQTVVTLTGWLDLSSGDSKHITYNSKIQESTHIFMCDYVKLPEEVTAESSIALINKQEYDVMLIDDPMEMHEQLEVYLKYTGGQ